LETDPVTRIEQVAAFLEDLAPTRLAESWDNVGLLVGDPAGAAERVMTCLSVTPSTAAEAVARRADLIVSHHPLPFRPLGRLTPQTTAGRMLLELIAARVAVYSPHTAFDSAPEGINQQLAERLQLQEIAPLVPGEELGGTGRRGRLSQPATLDQLAQRVKGALKVERIQLVGSPTHRVRTVAVACGAAGALLEQAHLAGCQAMLVGETRFHTCLEAEALGIGLLMPGHFASERFAVEQLAQRLQAAFPELEVWCSCEERDPIRWV